MRNLGRLGLGLWVAWGTVLLCVYYRQVGLLVGGNVEAWKVLRTDVLASRWTLALGASWIVIGGAVGSWFLRVRKSRRRGAVASAANQAQHSPTPVSSRRLFRSVSLIGVITALGTILIFSMLLLAAGLALPGKFPALGEAASRGFKAITGAGLVLLAAVVLGDLICRFLRWRSESRNLRLLFRLSCGMSAISYGLMVLGFFRLYRPEVVRWVVLGIGLGGGAFSVRLLLKRNRSQSSAGRKTLPFAGDSAQTAGSASPQPGEGIGIGIICLIIVCLAIGLALSGALAPETEFDALWYHLWLPKIWLAHGGPVDMIEEYISLYPTGTEVLFGAAMTLGGPVAAKLLHFAFLPLAALLVWEFMRRFAPRASPLVAVALFVTIPTVLWEATTAYIDLGLALIIGLAFYAAVEYASTRQRAWFVLAGLNLGFALLIKHLALVAVVIIVCGVALRIWLAERHLPRALGPALGLALFSLLIPLPWYVHSWRASGNPFFPDLYRLFGASPPERWDAVAEHGLDLFKAHFGRPRTLFNLLTLPWDFTVHAHRYGGTFGPLLALFLPGLFLRQRKRPVLRSGQVTLPWLAGFALLYTCLWASPLSSFQLRFVIPITPFLAVLAAVGFFRLQQLSDGRFLRWTFPGLLAVLLLLNLPPLTALHEGDRVGWDGWLTHVIRQPPLRVVAGRETQEDYLRRSLRSYAAWKYINNELPGTVRVLTFNEGDNFYSDRSRLWSDSVLARPAVWGALAGQEEKAFAVLRRLGISHILFDKRSADKTAQLAICQADVIKTHYALEYEDGGFSLYRLQ